MNNSFSIPFLDLSVSDDYERKILHNVLDRLLDHGQFVMGHEIEAFEELISNFIGTKFCVSSSSGTGALYLALRARGIGPGDQVITTPLSWIATANAIAMTGAEPVFADINTDLNIDPESISSVITSHTRAVLTVDYTGNPCKYDSLSSLVRSYSLDLIQDASQAFGAIYNGKYCGNNADIAAMSHNPMKTFAGLGEGGSVFTNSDSDNSKASCLRYNGTINKEFLVEPSLNFRMDSLQAAFLSSRLEYCLKNISIRSQLANIYMSLLEGIGDIILPSTTENSTRVYYTFTILTDKRDLLMEYLSSFSIETKIQHPLLMSVQQPFKYCTSNSPKASKIVEKILCLPIHHKLTFDHIHFIASKIIQFYA